MGQGDDEQWDVAASVRADPDGAAQLVHFERLFRWIETKLRGECGHGLERLDELRMKLGPVVPRHAEKLFALVEVETFVRIALQAGDDAGVLLLDGLPCLRAQRRLLQALPAQRVDGEGPRRVGGR